jgi:hypothetical protein
VPSNATAFGLHHLGDGRPAGSRGDLVDVVERVVQGLGTCGFNQHTAERMCKEAGFTSLRTLPLDNPFNNLYEVTP